MGYTDVDVFAGRDSFGNDVYGGFRFVVNVLQGSEILSAQLEPYLEQMYPADEVGVLDHFSDVNGTDLNVHTMDLGPATGWIEEVVGKTIEIQSNQALAAWLGDGFYSVECNNTDGTIITDAFVIDVGTNKGLGGILFRYDDPDNYWWFGITHTLGPGPWCSWHLYKVVGGSQISVDSLYKWQHSYVWHNLKVVLDGDNIKCYIDGSLQAETDDSAHNDHTKHGLFFRGVLGTPRGYWDDFEYIAPGTSSPNLIAACDDVDDSDGFDVDLPDTRTLTTAREDLGSISGWTAGWNKTSDISDIIQEVISRPGWECGNHLSVILYPAAACSDAELMRVTSYDGNSALGAKLYLGYISSSSGSGKEEYYDAGAALLMFGSTDWLAQTFTPALPHTLKSVRLYLDKDGTCGTVTVGIRATSGGQPTGADLGSGTIAEGDVPAAGGWVCVDITPNVALPCGAVYAIVVRADGDLSSIGWLYTVNEGGPDPYSGGEMQFSDDSGATWTDVADIGHPAGTFADADFEEWADACP